MTTTPSHLLKHYLVSEEYLPDIKTTRNGKISKCSEYTVNYTIKAALTCPTRGKEWGKLKLKHDTIDVAPCEDICYACKNFYAMPSSETAHMRNWGHTLHSQFSDAMYKHLSKKRKLKAVRIHDGGDMYSFNYLKKWIIVANRMPNIRFYFYTKRVSMIKNNIEYIPDNMTYIFSYGGTEDHLIDPDTDRHSVVFDCAEKMRRNGYVDASYDDTVAWKSDNHRIGLMIH